MPSFDQHQVHSLENLTFLDTLCQNSPFEFRWSITTCYYSALHLIHSFVAQKVNLHSENHEKLKEIVNPQSRFVAIRLGQDLYNAYEQLEMLSRKARYMSQLNIQEKHLIAAIEYLDEIMAFYSTEYPGTRFPNIIINCNTPALCKKLNYFEIIERVTA